MNTHHDPISFEKQIIMALKGFRRSKKITQTQLANRIGVSRDTIARIESGKARIYLAQVVAIAEALDIMLRDLLLQDEREDMIMIDENMSVSQQNVHITFSPPTPEVFPDSGEGLDRDIKYRLGDISERQPGHRCFSVGGRSPSINYIATPNQSITQSTQPTEVLGQAPNQPSLPKLQRRQATNPYLREPAVEHYGKPVKKFIMNHRLFWHWVPEDKLTGLSISSIVEATLKQGKSNDIKWLLDTMGIEKVADVFRWQISGQRHGYSKMTKDYFEAYFNRHAPEYSP